MTTKPAGPSFHGREREGPMDTGPARDLRVPRPGIKDGTKGKLHRPRHPPQRQEGCRAKCSSGTCTTAISRWCTCSTVGPRVEYEGQGQRTIRKGDCIHQRPGIMHREIACSEDVECWRSFPRPIQDAPRRPAHGLSDQPRRRRFGLGSAPRQASSSAASASTCVAVARVIVVHLRPPRVRHGRKHSRRDTCISWPAPRATSAG